MAFALAAQRIESVHAPGSAVWHEFLLRPVTGEAPWAYMQGLYRSRGVMADLVVLDRAVDLMSRHPEAGTFSVNVSAAMLESSSACNELQTLLHRHQIDPDRLILEILEQQVPIELHRVENNLVRLRRSGIRFAVDDFGPGPSNLPLLASGCIDFLKVDRSLLTIASHPKRALKAYRALKLMCDHFGVQVVAEGVETDYERRIVANTGIELIQGYLCHRPEIFEQTRMEACQ
ncbi:MAG: hypothetical protein Kow0020_01420 [Wenzhouxiangellaceae bacterium]